MKRFLSLALVFVLVLGMIPMAAATTPGVTLTPDKAVYTAGDTMKLTLSAPAGYTIDSSSITGSESWLAGWVEVPGSNGTKYEMTVTTAVPVEGTEYSYSVTCNLTPTSENTTGTAVTGATSGTVKHNVYTDPDKATITLNGDATAKTNQTVNLSAQVLPASLQDKTVAYSVSPTDGASITGGGVFVATKAGTYTVTATSNGKTATHVITVAASDYVISCTGVKVYPGQTNVPVPAVSVTKGTTALTAGTGFTVVWASGVADGKISAVNATTTITGTVTIAENGETYPVSFPVTVVTPVVTCANVSAQVGSAATLVPSITTGYTVQPTVQFVYPVGLTAATNGLSASIVSTTPDILSYTIGATVDGKTGVATATTSKVAFYGNYDVEVTMKDNLTSFLFKDATAIDGGISLSTLIGRTDCSNSPMGHTVTFGKLEDTKGKLTMPGLNIDTVPFSDLNGVGDVKFTVLNNNDGYWASSYTIKDGDLTCAVGVITIHFDEVEASIKYTTAPGKAFLLDEYDFKQVWTKAGYTGTPTYVKFENLPYYGDLYETNAMKVKVTTTDSLYFAPTGLKLDLDDVTYAPYGMLSNYTDEFTFAMYGGTNDATVVYGVVEVKVGYSNPFTDVKTSDYFYDAVMWAVEEEITAGTSATTFSPSQVCTRGQVVTFLWRAAGEPTPYTTVNPFSDVKRTDYFYEAVLWAYEEGITTGITATTFGPNQAITRSQAVTFLYRYHNEPTVTGTNSFVDVSSTAYYDDAVTWAVKNGITTGMSATKFAPNDGCTRAQIVTFLYRAYEG